MIRPQKHRKPGGLQNAKTQDEQKTVPPDVLEDGRTDPQTQHEQPRPQARRLASLTCYTPLRGAQSRETGKIYVGSWDRHMDNGVEVPCGNCIGCRIKRTRDWAIRCTHELQMTGKGMFITLTYAPERLPQDGSVEPSTLTAFIKTLRQRALRQSQVTGIRYFACGEYGEALSRPHYHLCVFGHSFDDMYPWSRSRKGEIQYRSDELEQCWKHGHSTIGELNQQSAGYTARYVMKKINGDAQEEHYQGKNPEFLKASNRPGIGRSWIERYLYDVYPDDFVVMPNGKRYSPPRYYDKFLEEFDPELFEQVKERRIARGKDALLKTAKEVGWQGVSKRLDQRHDFKHRQLKTLRRSYESEGL